MSDATLFIIGLSAIGVLALVPLLAGMLIVFSILKQRRAERRAEGRRVTRTVAGLGEVSSTDGEWWSGHVANIDLSLRVRDNEPIDTVARRALAIIADLPGWADRSRTYLASHEDCTQLRGGAAEFAACELEVTGPDEFTLIFAHSDDSDGTYNVWFRGGAPVASARDD